MDRAVSEFEQREGGPVVVIVLGHKSLPRFDGVWSQTGVNGCDR